MDYTPSVPGMTPVPALSGTPRQLWIAFWTGLLATIIVAFMVYTIMQQIAGPERFSVLVGSERVWYEIRDGEVVSGTAPLEWEVVPVGEMPDGATGAVYAGNGSVVSVTAEGVVSVDPDGVKTVIIDGESYDPTASWLSDDASYVIMLNRVTLAYDVFDLDGERPSFLTYVASLPALLSPEEYVSGAGFLRSGDLVLRISGRKPTSFIVYRAEDEAWKAVKTLTLPGATPATTGEPSEGDEGAFLGTSVAHAYTYGSPLVQTGSVTVSGRKCTGTLVTTMGASSGRGDFGPGAGVAIWNYMNDTGLPANYTTPGTYCIQGFYSSGVSGGEEPEPRWNASFGVYNGTGVTSATDYYTLVYSNTPSSVSLTLSTTTVNQGDSALLTWSATNVTACTPYGFSTGGALSGSVSVAPVASTTYLIQCAGMDGNNPFQSKTLTVLYNPDIIVTGVSMPSSTADGDDPVVASVTVKNNGVGSTGSSFQVYVTKNYVTSGGTVTGGGGVFGVAEVSTLAAGESATVQVPGYFNNPAVESYQAIRVYADNTGSGGAINERDESNNIMDGTPVLVTPVSVSGPVTGYLTAYPTSVANAGDPVTVTWSSSGASECQGTNFSTGGATSGSKTVYPQQNTTYSVTCSFQGAASGAGVWAVENSSSWDGWCPPGNTEPPEQYIAQDTCPTPRPTEGSACTAPSGCYYGYPINCGTIGLREYWCDAGQASYDSTPASIDITIGALTALAASCSVSPTTASIGESVTWTALATGGLGAGTYTYSWSGTDGLSGSNATAAISYASNGVKTGSITVMSGTEQVTVACSNGGGGIPTGGSSVTVGNTAPTVSLIATPSSVASGTAAMLTWTSTNATSCTGTGFNTGGATNNSSGVSTGPLYATTNYQISCTGPGGSANDTATVAVTGPAEITVDRDRVNSGGSTNLTWNTTACAAVSVDGTNGFHSILPTGSGVSSGVITTQTTFTLTCDGAIIDTIIVNVTPIFEEF